MTELTTVEQAQEILTWGTETVVKLAQDYMTVLAKCAELETNKEQQRCELLGVRLLLKNLSAEVKVSISGSRGYQHIEGVVKAKTLELLRIFINEETIDAARKDKI